MSTAGRERLREALAPARAGGFRRLTFDNGRSEEYQAVFVQHKPSGGEWDRILIARDDGTIAQLLVDLINGAALAHDRPSGSGLREAAESAAIWLEAEAEHPRPDPRPAMRLQASILHAALSGSSDPEAVGLDVKALEQAWAAHWLGLQRGPLRAFHHCGPSCAANLAAEYARLTEAKPESPS